MAIVKYLGGVAVCALVAASPAMAQGTSVPVTTDTPPPTAEQITTGGLQDIIVTARKRAETAYDAPVALLAIGALELERRSINNVEGIARVTPLFILGESSAGIAGTPLSIRGVGGSDINPFADQPVSFNIDGVQVSRSSVARIGTLDLASAEILKGPQALFFGKNSPGGIITLTSADPTAKFDSRMSVGYEFNADEIRADGYVSGPITDTLGIRVAGYYSTMKGYVRNDAIPIPLFPVKSIDRGPDGNEFAGRLTLKWEPNDLFSARLKASYAEADDSGHTSTVQIIGCGVPGTPQFGTPRNNCIADGQTSVLDPGPAFDAIVPTARGGRVFSKRSQTLVSLETNIKPVDNVTLTSITGYYRYTIDALGNVSSLDTANFMIGLAEKAKFTDFTQEVRLLTQFSGFINFAAGAIYQSSSALYDDKPYFFSAGQFRPLNIVLNTQKGEAYSAFGQIILKPTPELEISGGGRYSREDKSIRTSLVGVEQVSRRPAVSFTNFSPEITAKWSATPDVNLFASYRTGFLSGGFNGGAQANYTILDLTYDQQTTKGWEVGVKARLFDRTLRVNLSIFDYDLKGLQVSSTVNNVVFQSNAGKAHSRGVEFDANWQTPLDGLTLRGAVSYNRARYDVFTFACWKGQSIAQGCNLFPNAAGVFTQQSLAGQPIVRAPEWGATGGFNYDADIGSMRLGLSSDANYSGGYFNSTFNEPLAHQRSYWLFDASIRIGAPDDKWTLALVGRNLSNRYYVTRAGEQPFSGGASGTAVANRQADALGAVNRGREIMLRLTIKPNLFF